MLIVAITHCSHVPPIPGWPFTACARPKDTTLLHSESLYLSVTWVWWGAGHHCRICTLGSQIHQTGGLLPVMLLEILGKIYFLIKCAAILHEGLFHIYLYLLPEASQFLCSQTWQTFQTSLTIKENCSLPSRVFHSPGNLLQTGDMKAIQVCVNKISQSCKI